MSFIRGGETIQIKRRSKTSRDDFGNSAYSVITITVKDALIAIGSSSEPSEPARDHIDATLTLYLPNGTAIEDGDRFIIRNSEWMKDGYQQNWVSPFPGLAGGVAVPLRRRNG